MTPNAITRLLKEAHDAFLPLEGKLSNNDLLAIWETLLPLLMVIPYHQLNGVHFPRFGLSRNTEFETLK
jgi:hypothetical protein